MLTSSFDSVGTPHGPIRYSVTRAEVANAPWLVFLPGMLTDHRLFSPQLEHFTRGALHGKVNTFVWDPPAHGASRPYDLEALTVDGIARQLIAILDSLAIDGPVTLVGQSFGGIVGQAVLGLRADLADGFVGIDTMPLNRAYWNPLMLAGLKHAGPLLRMRSWPTILAEAPKETCHTEHAQELTREMLRDYTKDEYVALASRIFRAIADAVSNNAPALLCPAALIVGEHDTMGGIKAMNQRWAAEEGISLTTVAGAGHNANVDKPGPVNDLIEAFL
ncbi:alpha/beta hydrolase [Corynebacterium sp. Q4381]|uniref:alpha/beta fold hydrolase n=1 Tax=Corynebacterium sp. Marseille-Q4381 TaxID=3121597 RepID=UPI002FE69167